MNSKIFLSLLTKALVRLSPNNTYPDDDLPMISIGYKKPFDFYIFPNALSKMVDTSQVTTNSVYFTRRNK